MPHYADGTEAKVGDQVVGKLYNTDGKRAGTIISITPGVESCNAMVQFTESVAFDDEGRTPIPRMAVRDAVGEAIGRPLRGEQHGTSGPGFMQFTCADWRWLATASGSSGPKS